MGNEKVSQEQQKRIDAIVNKHMDYIDQFYTDSDKKKKKEKSKKDISLPEIKKEIDDIEE